MNAPAAAIDDDEAWSDAECTETFVGWMEQLNALEGPERHAALSDWAGGNMFSACGFLLEGWQGKLHREAWRRREADLDAATPGKAWNDADYKAGQETTARLLGVSGWKDSFYAAFPFRTLWTQEDEPWIAGAVGCPPLLDPAKMRYWSHLDIRHVIYWNPKTGAARLDDEAPNTSHVVLPEVRDDELTVYADVRAFFSAWARRRGDHRYIRSEGWAENRDGHLPGALIMGDPRKVRWPIHCAGTLIAGPGIDRNTLSNMVLRSANLPRILEASVGRG